MKKDSNLDSIWAYAGWGDGKIDNDEEVAIRKFYAENGYDVGSFLEIKDDKRYMFFDEEDYVNAVETFSKTASKKDKEALLLALFVSMYGDGQMEEEERRILEIAKNKLVI